MVKKKRRRVPKGQDSLYTNHKQRKIAKALADKRKEEQVRLSQQSHTHPGPTKASTAAPPSINAAHFDVEVEADASSEVKEEKEGDLSDSHPLLPPPPPSSTSASLRFPSTANNAATAPLISPPPPSYAASARPSTGPSPLRNAAAPSHTRSRLLPSAAPPSSFPPSFAAASSPSPSSSSSSSLSLWQEVKEEVLRDVAFSLQQKAFPLCESLSRQLHQRTVELEEQQRRAQDERRRAVTSAERERLCQLELATLRRSFDEQKAALTREKNEAVAAQLAAERRLTEREREPSHSKVSDRAMLNRFLSKDQQLHEKDRAMQALEEKHDRLLRHYNQLVDDHERQKAQKRQSEQDSAVQPIPASSHTDPSARLPGDR